MRNCSRWHALCPCCTCLPLMRGMTVAQYADVSRTVSRPSDRTRSERPFKRVWSRCVTAAPAVRHRVISRPACALSASTPFPSLAELMVVDLRVPPPDRCCANQDVQALKAEVKATSRQIGAFVSAFRNDCPLPCHRSETLTLVLYGLCCGCAATLASFMAQLPPTAKLQEAPEISGLIFPVDAAQRLQLGQSAVDAATAIRSSEGPPRELYVVHVQQGTHQQGTLLGVFTDKTVADRTASSVKNGTVTAMVVDQPMAAVSTATSVGAPAAAESGLPVTR